VTVKRRSYVAVSAAAVIAAALTAVFWPFSSGRSPDGPLGRSGPTQNAVCTPIPGWIITYGTEGVRNTGPAVATIQKLGYVHPRNLKVLATFVVPPRGNDLYGERNGYPPKWLLAERRMTVRPVKGNAPSDYSNAILVTRLTGPVGHADAVYLDYKENGKLYRLRLITSLTLKHGDGFHTGVCPGHR
jgi:hypothetical protein